VLFFHFLDSSSSSHSLKNEKILSAAAVATCNLCVNHEILVSGPEKYLIYTKNATITPNVMYHLNARMAHTTAIITYHKFSMKMMIGIAIHDKNSALNVFSFKVSFSSTNFFFISSSALYAFITECPLKASST
jgi:hypothetical protein